jgi:predicted TPR repeat methyltransferase
MNRLHAALPTVAKKCAWNLKYGLLGYPHFVAPEDIVRYLSARLPELSSLLDLGCGRGSLLRALRGRGWTGNYCGVDISKPAVVDARKHPDHRSSWVVSDFESFRSPFHWDLIAMVDSIYYLELGELPAFLGRTMGMLNQSGVLLLRVHDLGKHREYVEAASALYPGMEKVDNNLFCITCTTRHGIESARSQLTL